MSFERTMRDWHIIDQVYEEIQNAINHNTEDTDNPENMRLILMRAASEAIEAITELQQDLEIYQDLLTVESLPISSEDKLTNQQMILDNEIEWEDEYEE